MAKVDLELVKLILQRNEVEIRQVNEIMTELQREVQAQQEANEKPPPVKKQFCILVSDAEGVLADKELTGWVLQIPEEESPYTAPERIVRAAYNFNATPKGRRLPLNTIGEACEVVPARLFKEEQVWVKTKEPVLVLSTRNQIPKEDAALRKEDL